MNQSKIIKKSVNSLYMKNVSSRKGWSQQDASYKLVEFLTCGKKISLADFMESQ